MLITPQTVFVQDVEIRSEWIGSMLLASHISGVERLSLLHFDLGHLIERPAYIFEAALILAVTGPPGTAGEVSIGTVLTPWMSGPLSWSAPWSTPGLAVDADFEPLRSVPVVTPNDGSILKVKLDVSADVRRWTSGRLPNLGWRISSSLNYGAARNAIQAAQPTLSVKYSDASGAAAGAGISTGDF